MIVLDTNVVSELVKPSPDPAVLRWFAGQRDAELVTATPVLAEVWSGVALLPQGRRATDIARALAIFLTAFEGRVWLLDERAAVEYAAIVRERRDAGQADSRLEKVELPLSGCGGGLPRRRRLPVRRASGHRPVAHDISAVQRALSPFASR